MELISPNFQGILLSEANRGDLLVSIKTKESCIYLQVGTPEESYILALSDTFTTWPTKSIQAVPYLKLMAKWRFRLKPEFPKEKANNPVGVPLGYLSISEAGWFITSKTNDSYGLGDEILIDVCSFSLTERSAETLKPCLYTGWVIEYRSNDDEPWSTLFDPGLQQT